MHFVTFFFHLAKFVFSIYNYIKFEPQKCIRSYTNWKYNHI